MSCLQVCNMLKSRLFLVIVFLRASDPAFSFVNDGNSFESERRRFWISHITSSTLPSIDRIICFVIDFGPLGGIIQPSGCFPWEARTKIGYFWYAEARRFRYSQHHSQQAFDTPISIVRLVSFGSVWRASMSSARVISQCWVNFTIFFPTVGCPGCAFWYTSVTRSQFSIGVISSEIILPHRRLRTSREPERTSTGFAAGGRTY